MFEVVWFVLGGLMLFIGVDVATAGGLDDSWYYFLFAILAFVMYYLRRRMRINRR
jgi:membrane protein implicated in regulation of membrane protease activity